MQSANVRLAKISVSLLVCLAVAVAGLALIDPHAQVQAQKKISQLTADTAPTTDDLVETVNDPGGTPGSRQTTLANLTKGLNLSNAANGTLPVARGGTGITSFGTGVATLLGTPSSSNFAAAATDETGSGLLLFNTSPSFAGTPIFANGATSAGTIRFNEDTDDGSNYLTISIPALAADVALVLPANDGDANQVLTTNGSGTLSWTTPSAGGLTKFTEAESTSAPNGTVYVDSLTAAAASTNADVAIVPKGTGALLADVPDSTTVGGNKRGVHAVDWQMTRDSADAVASGEYSVIGGGTKNKAGGSFGAVCGGWTCLANGSYSFVGGGYANHAAASQSTIVGGKSNYIGTALAAIGGGEFNECAAVYSTIPGGYYAKTTKIGQVAHATGCFSSGGDAQTSVLVARRSTTDATPLELFLDGSSTRCTIATDTTWAFTITVVARRTDADNESAAYKFEGCIDRNGSTTALVGSVTTTVLAEDTAAWDCAVTADDTNDALIITVTGEAAKTIRWVARIELTEVSG